MKFVDVKNDVAFRKIFGNENRKEVLISFLNAILLFEDKQQIVDVDILTPFQLPAIKGGKVTIVDVKAKDKTGRTFIVEMQVAEVQDFDKRVLYYASKSYSAQLQRVKKYKKLNPVYFIGILDFEVTKNPSYLNRHKIIDIATGEHFIKDLAFNFIELPKFTLKADELNSIVEQWVYFIKNANDIEVIPENVKDKGLKMAYQDANTHNWTQEELDAYDYVLMREEDYRGRMRLEIKRAVEKAVEKAEIKGEKKGEIKGVKKVARSLKQKGIPIEVIMETTGLTEEEIQQL